MKDGSDLLGPEGVRIPSNPPSLSTKTDFGAFKVVGKALVGTAMGWGFGIWPLPYSDSAQAPGTLDKTFGCIKFVNSGIEVILWCCKEVLPGSQGTEIGRRGSPAHGR